MSMDYHHLLGHRLYEGEIHEAFELIRLRWPSFKDRGGGRGGRRGRGRAWRSRSRRSWRPRCRPRSRSRSTVCLRRLEGGRRVIFARSPFSICAPRSSAGRASG